MAYLPTAAYEIRSRYIAYLTVNDKESFEKLSRSYSDLLDSRYKIEVDNENPNYEKFADYRAKLQFKFDALLETAKHNMKITLGLWLEENNYNDGTWYFVHVAEEYTNVVLDRGHPQSIDDLMEYYEIAVKQFREILPPGLDESEIAVIDSSRLPTLNNHILMRGDTAFATRMALNRKIVPVPNRKLFE